MSETNFRARPYILHEANYHQTREFRPNVAILPWGATEAHNWHLPHGTDTIEASALAEAAAGKAVAAGAHCLVLPTIPFGNNNTQLTQTATITMRTATQHAVLFDVADSLVRQGIRRLVLLNFHGGNEFKAIIRDIMLDIPIFIVQIHGFKLASGQFPKLLQESHLGHADEFETSLLLHLTPHWVAPLDSAGTGATNPGNLPLLTSTPGVWFPRDWETLTADTGDGNPKQATAAKGEKLFQQSVDVLAKLLLEFGNANDGEFPLIIRYWQSCRTV